MNHTIMDEFVSELVAYNILQYKDGSSGQIASLGYPGNYPNKYYSTLILSRHIKYIIKKNKETYIAIMKLKILDFSAYFDKTLFWSNIANVIIEIVIKIRETTWIIMISSDIQLCRYQNNIQRASIIYTHSYTPTQCFGRNYTSTLLQRFLFMFIIEWSWEQLF